MILERIGVIDIGRKSACWLGELSFGLGRIMHVANVAVLLMLQETD